MTAERRDVRCEIAELVQRESAGGQLDAGRKEHTSVLRRYLATANEDSDWPCPTARDLSPATHAGEPSCIQIKSCGICGGQSGTGAGCLLEPLFPLPLASSTNCSRINAIYHIERVQ
jgi:hypothetical protein